MRKGTHRVGKTSYVLFRVCLSLNFKNFEILFPGGYGFMVTLLGYGGMSSQKLMRKRLFFFLSIASSLEWLKRVNESLTISDKCLEST